MDFDREYQKPRRPETPDDFIDSNVQALVEGRRKHPLPRPNVQPAISQCTRELVERAQAAQRAADEADRRRRERARDL